MDHRQLAVGGEVDVELDRVGPHLHAQPVGLHRVLGRHPGCPAVGDDDRHAAMPSTSASAAASSLSGSPSGTPRRMTRPTISKPNSDAIAIWYAPRSSVSEQCRDDRAVEDRPEDGAELPDEPVQAEHLADALRWREPQQHQAVDDANATEARSEQRAGDQERDGRQEQREDHEADRPGAEDGEEGAARAPSVREEAPAEARDHRHDGQDQEDLERLALGEADGEDREGAHHRDRGVDRIGVEEARDDEPEQPRGLLRVADRRAELRPGPGRVARAEPRAGTDALGDDEEERRGEQREERGNEREGRRRRLAVGIGADAGEEQDADEQRPAVAERHADAGEAAAGDRLRDVGEHRVVVDQRGLVGEVGDGEGDETEPDVDEADHRRADDAGHGEDREERLAPADPIAHRAEDRRHGGVDEDRDAEGRGEPERAVGLAEEADRPEAHREADDREAEDRVREVVQRPRERLDRAPRAGQPAESAPPGRRGQGGHGCSARHVIVGR